MLTLCLSLLLMITNSQITDKKEEVMKFELIQLPYANDGLEPVISKQTIDFHYGKHLLNYVNTLNTQFSPNGGGEPTGKLAEAIKSTWGSFENFQKEFVAAGTGLFGSGWVWLAKDKDGKLSITKEPNGSNPVVKGLTPIMGFDVWEHSYYLDYQNRRADHLNALWRIIDWETVGKRY